MHKKEVPEFIEKETNIKVSEGLVFLIDFPKKFSAKTIIKQVKSDNNPDPQNLEKISSKNSEFDKNFIIFSNSGIEFNDLFRNEFMADFLSLFETFEIKKRTLGKTKNDKISASFYDNSALIFFENPRSIFEPSLLFQQLNLITESKRIIHQLNAIFKNIKTINPQ